MAEFMTIDQISTKAKAGLRRSKRVWKRLRRRALFPLPAMSIGRLSGLLVLASALPILALVLLLYQQMWTSAQQTARSSFMTNARFLAALVDNEIDTHLAVAGTLAHSDALRNGELQNFHLQAKQALEYLPGSWVELLSPSRQLLMSTLVEPGTALPPSHNPGAGVPAGKSGNHWVSDLIISPTAKRLVAFAEYPVMKNGVLIYTVAISLEPTRFFDLLRDKFPAESAVGILDRNHRFVARIPDHNSRLGTHAANGWRDEITRKPEGVAETVTLEGRLSLTAYATSRDGWIAGISLPNDVLSAAAHQTLRSVILIGILAIFASLALGLMLSRRLSAILVDVARAARRVGGGHTVPAAPYPIQEAATISKALSETSHRLAARQEALRESEIRFRGTFENAAVGVAHVGLDGRFREVNDKLCDMLGYSRAELLARTVQVVTHPDDHATEVDKQQRLIANEITSFTMDKRCFRRDGSILWTGVTVAPRRNEEGAPLYFISVIRDITERKNSQDQQKFLVRELAHRLKNQLAIIQSMANQTARNAGSVNEFRDQFTQRARALAIGTDLLIDGNWSSADLAELAHRHLQHFTPGPSRLRCEGPQVSIDAEATHAIGLALHELATNCLKYGAWSDPNGFVQLSWQLSESRENSGFGLIVRWQERGGPSIVPPVRKGFGHVVMETMVAIKVGGTVKLNFEAAGLYWELFVPGAHLTSSEPDYHL
jgi:PAS domain S-box-containing protein